MAVRVSLSFALKAASVAENIISHCSVTSTASPAVIHGKLGKISLEKCPDALKQAAFPETTHQRRKFRIFIVLVLCARALKFAATRKFAFRISYVE